MDTERFLNNARYYAMFEGDPDNFSPSLELYLRDAREYSVKIWEGYLCDLFSRSVYTGMPWTGFTRDYHVETGTYGFMHRTIDIDEYLADLLPYKEREFLMPETPECVRLMCDFLEFAKREGKAVNVSWAEDFSEHEWLTDLTLAPDFWEQFDFTGGQVIYAKQEIGEEMLLVEYPDDISLKVYYHEYTFYADVYWKDDRVDRTECYKKAILPKTVSCGLSVARWEMTKTEHKPTRSTLVICRE